MTFAPPHNALGAELVWWREDGRQHTLLTLAGPLFVERSTGASDASDASANAKSVVLTFALHDAAGTFVTAWQRELRASETIFFDSRTVRGDVPASVTEGALVVWIAPGPDAESPARAIGHHTRAFAMVDWFSDDGAIIALHTDQSVIAASRPLELTEIVFAETERARTTLVIVNGRETQPVGSLELVLRNARGEERRVAYPHEMAPFSLHKLALAELTPSLVAFCGGAEATIAGRFEARGVFTRPYVMTEGAIPGGYHGGDRYRSRSLPRLVHRTFAFVEANDALPWELMLVSAQKELNPAYAVHGADLTTRLHLFQSHGDLEQDFFVDAALYDTRGQLVVRRERWAIAPRHGQTTCEVAELTAGQPFEGHIALGFSEDASKEAFPRRVQALLEYRTGVSFARTMLWSDRWNAPDRVRTQRVAYRALFRVFIGGERLSTLAITNPCVSADYGHEAPYVVRLRNARGDELVHEGVLAPFATKVATIAELFPERFEGELAIAMVESRFDLASMHLTKDLRSGVVAAEHLLAITERIGDELLMPCGA